MSGVSPQSDISISILPPESENDTTILNEGNIVRGILTDIIEPDGEAIILLVVAGELYEVPRSLAATLWPQVGRRIWLANLAGAIQAAEVSGA